MQDFTLAAMANGVSSRTGGFGTSARGGGFTGTGGSISAKNAAQPISTATSELKNLASSYMAMQAQSAAQQMAYQTASAERAMQFNAEEAQKNRDWQERMSNTQYQRAMADMKKAGLNPILAYTQGGAGVPSGATASGYAMSGAGYTPSESAIKAYMIGDVVESISKIATSAVNALKDFKWFK